MQSVSDDDVRKSSLEKPRFELAVKVVFRLLCSLHLIDESIFSLAIQYNIHLLGLDRMQAVE